jgi:hypothetical protein
MCASSFWTIWHFISCKNTLLLFSSAQKPIHQHFMSPTTKEISCWMARTRPDPRYSD